MGNEEGTSWEDIKKLKRKIDNLDHMNRNDPAFKKFLEEIEEELESMKYEMLINSQNP